MARPTSTLPTWATNAGTRETNITPGDQASGARAGRGIGSRIINGLFGPILDWLRFLVISTAIGGCVGRDVYLPPMAFNWWPVDSSNVSGDTLVTTDSDEVRVERNAGDRSAIGVVPHLVAGGTVSAVAWEVNSYTTTTGTAFLGIVVLGFDATGAPATGHWSANVGATGSIALAHTFGTTTLYGPLTIRATIRAGETDGDFVQVGALTMEF